MGKTLEKNRQELEQEALEALRRKIAKYGDEAEVITHQAGELTVDILTAEFTRFGQHLDTVTGEFLFRQVPGDPDGAEYFSCVLTMTDSIPLDQVAPLSYAISLLNFYMEKGCFALNKASDLLIYRSVRYFPGDTAEETLLRDCTLEMEQAYETAAKYATVVLALAEGSLPLEQFMDLLETE